MTTVLNAGAIELVTQMISENRGRRVYRLVAVAFSTAALWSPLSVGFVAVASVATEARPLVVLGLGALTAGFCLAIVFGAAIMGNRGLTAEFEGVELSSKALRVPLSLFLFVLGAHLVFPEQPVLLFVLFGLVGLAALSLARQGVLNRRGFIQAGRTASLVKGEAVVFVAVGFFVSGITALIGTLSIEGSFANVSAVVVWLGTLGMIVLGLLGVHPLVSLGVFGGLVIPMGCDPTLFAVAGLAGWALSSPVNPMATVNLVLQGLHDAPYRLVARESAPVVAAGALFTLPVLFVCERLVA